MIIAKALDEQYNFLGLARVEQLLEVPPRFILENDLPADTRRAQITAPCETKFLEIEALGMTTIYIVQPQSLSYVSPFTCRGIYLLIPDRT